MTKKQLQTLKNVSRRDEVDAVFVTGSHGMSSAQPHSDLDIVVILKDNIRKIRSVYTFIDGTFAETFFFDLADLAKLKNDNEIDSNTLPGNLLEWIAKAEIISDKSGTITKMKADIGSFEKKLAIPRTEIVSTRQKINYNLTANRRYFRSNDPLYHQALEVRLMYCIPELLVGFLDERGVFWRGEKHALKLIQEADPEFFKAFEHFTKAADLSIRFKAYEDMANRVFPSKDTYWNENTVIVNTINKNPNEDQVLAEYWKSLISE